MGKIWLCGGAKKKRRFRLPSFLRLASLVSGVPPKRVFADCQIGGQKRITLMHVCSLEFRGCGNAEKMVSKQARVFEFPKVYNGLLTELYVSIVSSGFPMAT